MAAVSRLYIITPCGYKHCAHGQYFRRACGKIRRAERIAYDKSVVLENSGVVRGGDGGVAISKSTAAAHA